MRPKEAPDNPEVSLGWSVFGAAGCMAGAGTGLYDILPAGRFHSNSLTGDPSPNQRKKKILHPCSNFLEPTLFGLKEAESGGTIGGVV